MGLYYLRIPAPWLVVDGTLHTDPCAGRSTTTPNCLPLTSAVIAIDRAALVLSAPKAETSKFTLRLAQVDTIDELSK